MLIVGVSNEAVLVLTLNVIFLVSPAPRLVLHVTSLSAEPKVQPETLSTKIKLEAKGSVSIISLEVLPLFIRSIV